MKSKLLWSLLMLAVIITGAVLLDQELFRVRAVVVHGCDTRPAEEVTALSAVEYGQSVFRVDLKEVAENIARSPYYEVQEVARVYPNLIRVTVRERKARAVALNLGSYLIMDSEGYILEIRTDRGYAGCPMVEGLKIETYGVGQKLGSSDSLQLRAMEKVLTALETQEVMRLISAIELHNVLDIRLFTVDGYRVMVGDSDNLDQKLNWLQAGMEELRTEGLYGGTIYLSANNASYLLPGVQDEHDDRQDQYGDWAFGVAQGDAEVPEDVGGPEDEPEIDGGGEEMSGVPADGAEAQDGEAL